MYALWFPFMKEEKEEISDLEPFPVLLNSHVGVHLGGTWL
jgi:hypothetical protein